MYLVFHPLVEIITETVQATLGQLQLSLLSPPELSETLQGRQRGGSNGNTSISILCLPALMDVSLFWRDNEIKESQNSRLLWCMWTRVKKTHLIPLCHHVYYA